MRIRLLKSDLRIIDQVCKTLKTSSATRIAFAVKNKARLSWPVIYRNWRSNSQWKVEVGLEDQ